jgi:beta-glucosidase/6-phospho-beta-glucosidase/beta-galactosidase
LRSDTLVLFSEEEKECLRSASIDFLGVNYYSSTGVKQIGSDDDSAIPKFENVKIGTPTGAGWLRSYPDGMPLLFKWLSERYAK